MYQDIIGFIMERTLLIIKPGALQRGIAGEIITRFEKRGLKLVAMKMARLDDEILSVHYAHLLGDGAPGPGRRKQAGNEAENHRLLLLFQAAEPH